MCPVGVTLPCGRVLYRLHFGCCNKWASKVCRKALRGFKNLSMPVFKHLLSKCQRDLHLYSSDYNPACSAEVFFPAKIKTEKMHTDYIWKVQIPKTFFINQPWFWQDDSVAMAARTGPDIVIVFIFLEGQISGSIPKDPVFDPYSSWRQVKSCFLVCNPLD